MELQVGVKAFLRNSEGRILLLKRSSNKYDDIKDKWDLAGGRIEPGTPLSINLKREVMEETGLEILDEPKLLAAQDILKTEGVHVVRLTYIASIDGEPKLSEEHSEYGYFTLDDMRTMQGLDQFTKELLNKSIMSESVLDRR